MLTMVPALERKITDFDEEMGFCWAGEDANGCIVPDEVPSVGRSAYVCCSRSSRVCCSRSLSPLYRHARCAATNAAV